MDGASQVQEDEMDISDRSGGDELIFESEFDV